MLRRKKAIQKQVTLSGNFYKHSLLLGSKQKKMHALMNWTKIDGTPRRANLDLSSSWILFCLVFARVNLKQLVLQQYRGWNRNLHFLIRSCYSCYYRSVMMMMIYVYLTILTVCLIKKLLSDLCLILKRETTPAMIKDAVISECIKDWYLKRHNRWPDVETNPVIQKSSKIQKPIYWDLQKHKKVTFVSSSLVSSGPPSIMTACKKTG